MSLLSIQWVDRGRLATGPRRRTVDRTRQETSMKVLRLGRTAWRLRALVAVCAGVAAATAAEARVTRIVIDSTTAVTGGVLAYETLRGRAFGELDPNDAKNATITDIQ